MGRKGLVGGRRLVPQSEKVLDVNRREKYVRAMNVIAKLVCVILMRKTSRAKVYKVITRIKKYESQEK